MDWNEWICMRMSQLADDTLPIAFTADNKTAFVADGDGVLVVDVGCSRQKHRLQHAGHVIAIFFVLPYKLLTYTDEGVQTTWNTNSWKISQCCDLNISPICIYRFEDQFSLAVTENECKEFLITKFNENADSSKKTEILKTASHNLNRRRFAVTEKYFVCCEKLFVHLYVYGNDKSEWFKYFGKAQFMDASLLEFFAVAARGEIVAACISYGRIFIWNDVCSRGIRSFSQSVHWNKWAPFIELTNSGSLISAGCEGVVAKFTLSSSKTTNKPLLLPRLQAPVNRIGLSPDDSTLFVGLNDNSCHFILLSTMSILSSMPTLLHSPRVSMMTLTLDPLNPNLVVHSARPGTIQWLNPYKRVTVATCDISRENLVEGDNIFSGTHDYTDVCAVAFSLVNALTVDCHSGLEVPYNRLQFWRRNNELGSLALEDIVAYGNLRVVFVRASLDTEIFISVDEKGLMCTWKQVEVGGRKWHKTFEVHWMDASIIHLSQIRNSHFAAIHKVDEDNNSVMAIWRIDESALLHLLHVHQGDGRLRQVEWCSSQATNHLLLASDTCVSVFNVENVSTMWIVCQAACSIGISSQYSVIFSKNTISVIDSVCGKLLCQRDVVHEPTCVLAIGCDESFALVTAYESGYEFVMSRNMLEEQQQDPNCDKSSAKVLPFAHLSSLAVESEQKNPEWFIETASAITMLSGAAHTLAPVPILASKFIRSCLLPNNH